MDRICDVREKGGKDAPELFGQSSSKNGVNTHWDGKDYGSNNSLGGEDSF